MKILSIVLIFILIAAYLIVRQRALVFSRWGGVMALRITIHIVLLALIVVGGYYSFTMVENSIPQKLTLSATFGAFLFWVTPFCLKFFKYKFGIMIFVGISILSSLVALYSDISDIKKEYCIELSVGIMLLLFLEFFFKERNKALMKLLNAEYAKVLDSINQQNSQKIEEERITAKERLKRIEQENEDDYKYAWHDYLQIPRPIFNAEEND